MNKCQHHNKEKLTCKSNSMGLIKQLQLIYSDCREKNQMQKTTQVIISKVRNSVYKNGKFKLKTSVNGQITLWANKRANS